MSGSTSFLKTGHWPTLLASFLYFDFCFAIWVLNGAMGPFIGESFGLTPSQQGFMISVPILAGALMRFPLGVLAQWPACTVFGGPPLAYAPRGAFVSECSV